MFLRVMALSFLVTLLLAAPYISRKAPELIRSLSDKTPKSTVATTNEVSAPGTENTELEELMADRRASGRQVKPTFDNLPAEFFSANKPFSLDFHRLPVDYLAPQAPETTRNALALIRKIKEAEEKAFSEQQKIATGNAGSTDFKGNILEPVGEGEQ